ncbi:hypothetical protein ACS0TY_017029 [Phlomoides rotata]
MVAMERKQDSGADGRMLKDTFVETEVKRCIHVGLLCIQNFAEDIPEVIELYFQNQRAWIFLPTKY